MIALALAALAAAASAGPTVYTIGGAPSVRFEIDAPLDTIGGVNRAVRGTARVDLDAWAQGTAEVEVDLAGFATGIALRDQDLRDQFFETSRFPKAILRVQRFEAPSVEKLAPGITAQATAVSTFELRGVQRTLRVPVQVRADVDEGTPTLRVTGAFPVELEDFGMKRPRRLFLKLGPRAEVRFEAVFFGLAASTSEPAAAAPALARIPLQPIVVAVARPPQKQKRKAPRHAFAADTLQGRGERLVADPTIGGEGNGVSCLACHGAHDEREGLAAADGTIPPSSSLYGAARRASLWQGFAKDPGHAGSLCAKMFMLRKDDLPDDVEQAIAAYVAALTPDPSPEVDYRALRRTKQSALEDPTGGDARRGRKLAAVHCGRCHVEGGLRPPLTPGLYEPDDVVRRARWLQGHDAVQMPPLPIGRLQDSELRDIVTWLCGDPSERVFDRRSRR